MAAVNAAAGPMGGGRGVLLAALLAALLAGASRTALGQGDFQRGISFYKQGNFQRAAVEFEALVRANPKYEDGYRILGDCYLNLKDYPKAIESFREALRLRSDLFPTYYGLALAYFNSGRYQEASATLQRGERLLGNFDRYRFYHLRGSALYNSGQYAAAVADLSEAVRLRPTRDDLLQLAQAHRELGNVAEAQRAFNRVLALEPANRTAQEALAEMELRLAADMIEQRRFSEAVNLLSDHIRRNPGSGAAFYNLGLAHLFTDRLREAEEAFGSAVRLSPSAQAFDRLGFVQEKQGKYPQALAAYRRSQELGNTRAAESVERVQKRMAQR